MNPNGQLRVADTDRQGTADRLRVAADEGRLHLDEYDQRLQLAYAATTYADLRRLTADLPPPATPPRPGPPPAPPPPARAVADWIAGLPIGCLVLLVVLVAAILD